MKKIVIGVISLICIIGIGLGLSIFNNSRKYGKIKTTESGGTITSWTYTILDPSIVKLSHIETKSKSKKDEVGNSYEKIYYFEGIKEGKTKIRFTYGDSGFILKYTEYEVIVDKDLNVKVKIQNMEE